MKKKKNSKKNKYVRQHTKISMDKDLNVSNISISTNDKEDYNKRMEKLNNAAYSQKAWLCVMDRETKESYKKEMEFSRIYYKNIGEDEYIEFKYDTHLEPLTKFVKLLEDKNLNKINNKILYHEIAISQGETPITEYLIFPTDVFFVENSVLIDFDISYNLLPKE